MTTHALHIDPEIHGLIPPLTAEERSQLEANIKADGRIIAPLIAWKGHGILLDGHNRREISEATGIGYEVEEIDLPDRHAAIAWVIFNQLGRRNLTAFQRAELALRLKPGLAAAADARKKSGKKSDPVQNSGQGLVNDPVQNSGQGQAHRNKTTRRIAAEGGVSHDTVSKVEQIIADAAPPIVEMARAGRVSVDAAAIVAELPKDDQEQLAQEGAKAVKTKAASIRKAKSKAKDKKKDAAPPAPSLVDELGVELPDRPRLREAAAARPVFDEMLSSLRKVRALINAVSGDRDKPSPPAGIYLDRQVVDRDYKNLYHAISFARFYGVCPYCKGKGCPKSMGCRGEGWFPETQYNNAPPEMKTVKGGVKC